MNQVETSYVNCCHCGTTFAVADILINFRKADGKPFFCPNGHEMFFTDNRDKKLAEALTKVKELTQELADAQVEIRQLKCAVLAKPEGQTILQKLGLS